MRSGKLWILVLAGVLALAGCVDNPHSTITLPPEGPPVSRPDLPDEFIERIGGSSSTLPLTTSALRFLRGTSAGLRHDGTQSAIDALIAGHKDVIFVPTLMEDQLRQAAEASVNFMVAPLAKEALVFLVNPDNPVDALTTEQIREIYSAEVTTWAQLGGDDARIIPYQRSVGSTAQSLFLELALDSPMDPPTEIREDRYHDLVESGSEYDNSAQALGFTTFHSVQQMHTSAGIKLLAIDGVTPTTQTIADGSYPYQGGYWAVMRSDEPTDSPAFLLVSWLLTWEGQRLASTAGYVPLDQSNIVPMRADYGFYSSTPENTTTSTGRGGTDRAPEIPDPCYNPQAHYNCLSLSDQGTLIATIPGYPLAQTTMQTWIDSLDPAETYSTLSMCDVDDRECTREVQESYASWSTFSSRGVILIERNVSFGTGEIITSDSALFRLSDGLHMGLADVFFTGVNYIEFINGNLLNTTTNQALSDCMALANAGSQVCSVGTPTAHFTGIANDYPFFTVREGVLTLRLPAGNPFLVTTSPLDRWGIHDSYVPLRLPGDLSPYGDYWRAERVKIGDIHIELMSRDFAGPNPLDLALNENIIRFVEGQPGAQVARIRRVASSTVLVGIQGGESAYFDYTTGERL